MIFSLLCASTTEKLLFHRVEKHKIKNGRAKIERQRGQFPESLTSRKSLHPVATSFSLFSFIRNTVCAGRRFHRETFQTFPKGGISPLIEKPARTITTNDRETLEAILYFNRVAGEKGTANPIRSRGNWRGGRSLPPRLLLQPGKMKSRRAKFLQREDSGEGGEKPRGEKFSPMLFLFSRSLALDFRRPMETVLKETFHFSHRVRDPRWTSKSFRPRAIPPRRGEISLAASHRGEPPPPPSCRKKTAGPQKGVKRRVEVLSFSVGTFL